MTSDEVEVLDLVQDVDVEAAPASILVPVASIVSLTTSSPTEAVVVGEGL
jgi:hypothetical protein